MKNNYRTEYDAIGAHQVPVDVLYGVQTQRAIELYPLNGEESLSEDPQLIHALLQVKKIAARTNIKTGELNPLLGQAILEAIEELLCDIQVITSRSMRVVRQIRAGNGREYGLFGLYDFLETKG